MGNATGLATEQSRALGRLMSVPGIERFYLAGGTAIVVHLQHRRSLDLDLFSVQGDVDLGSLSDALRLVVPELEVIGLTDATLRVRVAEVPVDIVRYSYPLLEVLTPRKSLSIRGV
jgi:hypothetical protein